MLLLEEGSGKLLFAGINRLLLLKTKENKNQEKKGKRKTCCGLVGSLKNKITLDGKSCCLQKCRMKKTAGTMEEKEGELSFLFSGGLD